TKNLSNQSFRAVSLDRAAEFLRGGDAQPARSPRVREDEDRAEAAALSRALVVDLLEIGPPPDALLLTKTHRPRLPIQAGGHLFGLAYSELTVSRLRPLARRRFNTRRPFLVLIRTRNPCARTRRRLFG